MKKKMQSILSLVLVVLMLMSVVPLSVNAAEYSGECGAEGDNVTWEIDVNTGTLFINGTGDMADYDADWFVTPWYEYREFPSFSYIVVGEGVTSIGDNAFKYLSNVVEIILPSTVKELGISSLQCGNSDIQLVIEESNPYLKMDDYGVIYSADSKTLIYVSKYIYNYSVPEGVEEFAPYAFSGGYIYNLFIPASIKSIPVEAFLGKNTNGFYRVGCPSFSVDKNNLYYSSDEYGVLFDKNKEILYIASLRDKSEQLVPVKYIIPETVKEIADYAFYSYVYSGVFISENVTKIGSCAFRPYAETHGGSWKYYLYIPKNVTFLADDFFVNEELLTEYAGEIFAVVYYEGTQEEWEALYKGDKDWLTVYYEHEHTNTIVEETCTQKIYTCSGCKTPTVIEDIGDNHHWSGGPETDRDFCVGGMMSYFCFNCFAEKEEYFEPLGHNYYYVSDNNATCTDDGTIHEYCSRCGGIGETVVDVGSKLGHDFGASTVLSQQSCTQDGISVQACKRCAEIVATIEGAYGHFDNDGDGKCDECKVVLEVIFPNVPSVPGTDVTPDAPGHTHSFTREVIFSSDCVTAGEQEFTCSCGEIYRAVIPANGHTDENADGVCDVCDESLGEKMGDSEVSGFLAKILEFFNKIAEFFRKLFNMA